MLLVVFWLLAPGCAAHRSDVERSLMSDQTSPARQAQVADAYRVACPDLLEVAFPHNPQLTQVAAVDADGRLPLAHVGRLRVEGRCLPEVERAVAEAVGLPPQEVSVRVADFRSQYVYLFGEVNGSQRAVPYRGPETVLDLLQRAGGITPGAEPNDVYVIRSHLDKGKRPEVFHVDLRAIVLAKDDDSNIRLQPFDQVHVGETRQALVERCMPQWCRPFYRMIWDTHPADDPPRSRVGQRLTAARRRAADRQ